ncbi:MAG: hypothetical protein E5W28_01910 [Mesorhizobium sp.]|uniref:hypothetical protein n=1 Tax=Mesorhizobium sp. TaxID=1871066 RepID=UPI000FE67F5A|nr:hypothetical protein [Mesorhizobium sp.]RWE83475.1 MAG: hypothetical protein EOS63_04950 [Mesorhizobium sp.]TIU41832.1 MAG: hypothetical protein E5W28_01910 [Mesorhizobium sp.]TIU43667.1 MAG: hypothetical protein E5W31_02950 [Mesorhizobium sp.]TJW61345.1 MAG: hypothetical protein E5V97_20830 [Mesorhizobium sp.]
MFFLKASRIFAILVLIAGVIKLAIGFTIATEVLLPYELALERYAPNAKSSGELIDKGLLRLLIAFALGALSEIGLALVRKERAEGNGR